MAYSHWCPDDLHEDTHVPPAGSDRWSMRQFLILFHLRELLIKIINMKKITFVLVAAVLISPLFTLAYTKATTADEPQTLKETTTTRPVDEPAVGGSKGTTADEPKTVKGGLETRPVRPPVSEPEHPSESPDSDGRSSSSGGSAGRTWLCSHNIHPEVNCPQPNEAELIALMQRLIVLLVQLRDALIAQQVRPASVMPTIHAIPIYKWH